MERDEKDEKDLIYLKNFLLPSSSEIFFIKYKEKLDSLQLLTIKSEFLKLKDLRYGTSITLDFKVDHLMAEYLRLIGYELNNVDDGKGSYFENKTNITIRAPYNPSPNYNALRLNTQNNKLGF